MFLRELCSLWQHNARHYSESDKHTDSTREYDFKPLPNRQKDIKAWTPQSYSHKSQAVQICRPHELVNIIVLNNRYKHTFFSVCCLIISFLCWMFISNCKLISISIRSVLVHIFLSLISSIAFGIPDELTHQLSGKLASHLIHFEWLSLL